MEMVIDGHIVLFDEDDYLLLSLFKWRVYKFSKKNAPDIFYAQTHIGNKRIYMHKLILRGCINEVDHKNRNGLDNRKSNLRNATRSQNSANKPSYKGTSKFKGVCKANTVSDRYRAWIMIDGKSIYLGSFKEERDAAIAYNEAAFKAWGEFALLNTVD